MMVWGWDLNFGDSRVASSSWTDDEDAILGANEHNAIISDGGCETLSDVETVESLEFIGQAEGKESEDENGSAQTSEEDNSELGGDDIEDGVYTCHMMYQKEDDLDVQYLEQYDDQGYPEQSNDHRYPEQGDGQRFPEQ